MWPYAKPVDNYKGTRRGGQRLFPSATVLAGKNVQRVKFSRCFCPYRAGSAESTTSIGLISA
jgi:hypothetical protein